MIPFLLATWPVLVIALAPLATSWLPFESALRAQAVLIVLTLAVAGLPQARHAVERLRGLPKPLAAGIGLYLGAALWGAAVGLASGNATRDVLGQSLSMLLVPLGVAAFAVIPRFSAKALVDGLSVAGAVTLALHLGAMLHSESIGPYFRNFRFDTPAGSFVTAGGMIVLLCLARFETDGSRLALLGACAGLVLLAGGMSRGAWISTVLGIFFLSLLQRGWRHRTLVVLLRALPILCAAVVLAGLLTPRIGTRMLESPAVDVPSRKARMLLPEAPVDGTSVHALEIEIGGAGPAAAQLLVWIQGLDGTGRVVLRARHQLTGSELSSRSSVVVTLPPSMRRLRIGATSRSGAWSIDGVTVRTLRSPLLATLKTVLGPAVHEPNVIVRGGHTRMGRWIEALVRRAEQATAAFWRPTGDASLGYRIREWSAVRAQWSRAGGLRLLLGQGLGARFPFRNPSRNARGEPVMAEQANYIHDFYVFLLFKLGIAGVLALAGLFLVAGWTGWSAWKGRHCPEWSWFLAAAAAAWITYLIWSLTSPEILDFRMAPLWGAVVAASGRASDGAARRSRAHGLREPV